MTVAPLSPLGNEQRRFGELFGRLIDAFLNRLFDLGPRAANSRLQYLIFLFLLSGFLISLINYPLRLWAGYLQDIFFYLLSPTSAANYPGNPFSNFLNFVIQAFTDPRTLQYLPIFLAPFFIALQTAANYLADVFELDDPSVARRFVQAVALTGSNETIRITQGNVLQEHKKSPTFLIGGPGRVLVDMDSAALFEKPDGTPRVIGPTGKETGGKARLDGFERFRQAIDLRPHVIELRGEDGKSAEIQGHSLDGIPITATDVCFVFSVHRNGQTQSVTNPYPFRLEAIEPLVYKAASQVKTNQPNPSEIKFSGINNMVGLVRGRLIGFMNDHKLTEYLASFGQPEVDRFNQHKNKTIDEVKNLAHQADKDLPKAGNMQRGPFFPRDKIKCDLFGPFAAAFSKIQYDKGVELFWIGLGTWMVPTEIVPETRIVPEQHIEAWRISRENIQKAGDIATGSYKNEVTVQKYVNMIQEVPVAKPLSATTKVERTNAMKALLGAYRLQLIQAAEFLSAKGNGVPDTIIRAIECISKVLGEDWHWPGAVVPDPPDDKCPSSDEPVAPDRGRPSPSEPSAFKQESNWQRSEEALYTELIILVHGERAVAERLIEKESKDFPMESRRQWIERARDRLLHDRGSLH
jgi:hypothetical protein